MRRAQRKTLLVLIVLWQFFVTLKSEVVMAATGQQKMIEEQIISRNITDKKVLKAMLSVDRTEFVPKELQPSAWNDSPLPIGYGQTISQPYIVAFMTEAAKLDTSSKVLEIGTGSGYQAAILAEMCKDVYTIEVVKELGDWAEKHLAKLGYSNIHVRVGDGYKGWPEQAPFDAIIVTAAPEELPITLVEQLREGGRLIIPVGKMSQELLCITRTGQDIKKESLLPVRFVPMIKTQF
jgi:protein-L-isoaspartate(D-aspartate) O-methyltransferase